MVFFFNDTATTEIYTLSLHDALPISKYLPYSCFYLQNLAEFPAQGGHSLSSLNNNTIGNYFIDRKSTRLNSSHANISYAVFCLKKNNYSSPSLSTCFITSLLSPPLDS